MNARTIWDVDVQRRFPHAKGSFDLRARFESDARRLVLHGPSGAGKSQTLKMIAGLTRPTAGHVRVAGRTLHDPARGIDVPARRRRLGYVFQDYALFPHLNVLQNVAFGLHRGWWNARRDVRDARVERSLEAFGLQAVAHHVPDQLSGGQRQRVALARALVAEPQALLLDEPFASLDPALRARLRDELSDLLARLDLPLLLITHDADDVRRFGDEVFRIEAGLVRERVAPSALPRVAFAA